MTTDAQIEAALSAFDGSGWVDEAAYPGNTAALREVLIRALAAAEAAAPAAAAGFCSANHFFHPAASCSRAPSSLCSAMIVAYISAQFSSVTAGTAVSRIP